MNLEDQYRFELEAFQVDRGDTRVILACTRNGCPWLIEIDEPTTLAELNQRAAEHTEVCR